MVPTQLTFLLSFKVTTGASKRENRVPICNRVLYSGFPYVVYAPIMENMDNSSLKSAIKRKLEKLRTR